MAEVQTIAVDSLQAQRIGDVSSPGLKRNELTRDAKRNQLASLGVRGADADKVLNDLYGAET